MLGKRRARTFRKYSARKRRATEFNTTIAPRLGFGVKPYGKGYQPVLTNDGDTPELKWHDVGRNLTTLDTAPSATNPALFFVSSLVGVTQGDEPTHRNGNKIQAKKISIRVKVAVDANSDAISTNLVASAHTFRVLMICDTQPNGQGAQYNQIFETSPNNDAQEWNYNKLSSTGRFKVLMDKFVTVPPSMVVYDSDANVFHTYGNERFFKKTVPLDMAIRFSDGTSNLSSIQKNNVFLLVTSDATASALPQHKFSFRCRLRFKDY